MGKLMVRDSNVFGQDSNNSNDQIRVACAGDSLTEISEYTNYLSEMLGEGYLVGNFGVCGSTIALDSDNPYLYSGALEDSRAFQPNIVVIMLGTNDAALCREHLSGNFIDDYITLTKHYQTFASEPKLWIVKPPHIFSDICLSVEVFERYIIPAIEQIAFRTNFQIIDAYSVVNSSEYFLDGVHPNVRGARMIAQEVYKSINSIKPNYHQP